MDWTPRQTVYALLAGIGLLGTWTFNLLFLQAHGGIVGPMAFVAGGYANHAASSLTNDLLVGVAAFLVWSFAEARRLGMRRWWAYVAVTFLVAFAVAFPLFLLMRERRLAVLKAEGGA